MLSHKELIQACKENNINVLYNSKVNFRENNHEAFRTACEYGNLNIVKLLLEQEKTVHDIFIVVNSCKTQGLRRAAKNGHKDMVLFLISCGAIPFAKNNEALRLAIKHQKNEVVEILQNLGCKFKRITIEKNEQYGQ